MRAALPLLLAASLPVLGGCVALAVPVAAAGVMGRKVLAPGEDRAARIDTARPPKAESPKSEPGVTYLPVGSSLPPPTLAADQAVPAPSGMQYLYGSGEAAAASLQAWRALIRYVAKAVETRPGDSVILADGASIEVPHWVPCGNKPLAAVFDVDETVLLNLGFEYDAATGTPFSEQRWQAWEQAGAGRIAAVPGAKDAIGILRTMGVAVIFNSNRTAANAAATEAVLDEIGVGPARHGDTLFLSGDDATGARKDARRAAIAARFCVIAMGGDQLGDFSDLFNAGQAPADRRAAAASVAVSAKWGAGWFMLPNPVYGSAMKGGVDDIFPAAARWSPKP